MTTQTETTKATLFATREQYIAAIEKAGAAWTEQSGFIKVQSQSGARLYVAATKTVRRVDMSGFELPLSEQLTNLPKGGVFGKVLQQMVVGTGPEGDLERFEEVLAAMLALPVPEKVVKVKAPKAPKAKGAVKTAPVPRAPETTQSKADRIALIKKIAMERGLAISSKSVACAGEVETLDQDAELI